jgi:isomerase DpgB
VVSAAGNGAGLVLRVDGAQTLSIATVKAMAALCARAEDHDGPGLVAVHLSGAPGEAWTADLDVALVTKWERTLRRLERLPMTTVALASGDCGGPALDVLLATDFRIATPDVRLLVPVHAGATWPGMAIYRLAQQAGTARIRRAVLLGAPIEAGEALALHLVDELADDPLTALAATAELAGGVSGRELAIRRQLMFDASVTSFEDALGSHLAACDRALRRASAGAGP